MSRDRTRTRDRPEETSIDGIDGTDLENDEGSRSKPTRTGGLRGRVARRAGSLFSPRRFVVALIASAVGLFAVNAVVPLPGAGLLGIFAASFLFGLAVEERRYAEAAAAGAAVAGASTLLDFALVALLGGIGLSLSLVAGGVGAVAGLAGTYFGRDLRAGLRRDI